ncbi:clathrin interactor EPSIN 2-like [Andrographis paniculata]|uniref:clathrin interactor EPSIN 2-like n=1 Tax=Andrographis paniculata TaxID=175694 RepID=UPI0021E7F8A2|nr:clathrin interactor EPSIN 2-like [Andrographis paniculata]XP_051149930.1 clathrin interactor EPSIN 2-like [Andrographis paniculata]XP_051149931.1 clathrin interactor EPSIN 2-like [Andrographis paniculata]
MKKAIDQTVRDLKRGVNKKVLKVPIIEQKVLDATSNESWGPHGSVLADIAQATRNYHEYQIIMSIIWRRLNDTGKDWRHVYKALIVLEYLVGHGSERVIDDIREHVYQISTLSDFQYIDSHGKDQGNNVRRKSQSLVVLVNDKERIQEVREKAAANRDKYRSPATGSMYRPGSSDHGDKYHYDRYEGRYADRGDNGNGYGRDRDWGSRDDDRYGRHGDSYGREGERYDRHYEDRYRSDGYRDDDYRGRGQTTEDYNYNSGRKSADQERDRTTEGDGQLSSRDSGAKADDHAQNGRFDRKSPDQNPGLPPSYEDAVSTMRGPTSSDRDGGFSLQNAPQKVSPPVTSPGHAVAPAPIATVSPLAPATDPTSASSLGSVPNPALFQSGVSHNYNEVVEVDEFDPRASLSAAPATSSVSAPAASGVELDFLGSLTESFSSNSLALIPSNSPGVSHEANGPESMNPGPSFAAASSLSTFNTQSLDDPFGDGPFKATSSTESASIQTQIPLRPNPINSNSTHSPEAAEPPSQRPANEFGGNYHNATSDPSGFPKQEFSIPNPEVDILAGILSPSAHSSFVNTQAQNVSSPQTSQSMSEAGVSSLTNQATLPNSFQAQPGYPLQPASSALQAGQTMPLSFPIQAGRSSQMGFGSTQLSHAPPHANFYGTYNSLSIAPASAYTNSAQMQSTNQSSTGLAAAAPQSSTDKFETKSSVWADTLSRGLVNLNISGPKTNPLADIGVDFDAINRKEKRMEKPSSTVTSTVTMGKAMGSGSGLGQPSTGALRPLPNSMMNSAGPGAGIGMVGYGVRQPMGIGLGTNMQQPMGFPSGAAIPGAYNSHPMMGTGNYSQQPYGGYR